MSELRTQLEKGTDESKVDTMKRILTIMLNGDSMPQLLMHIIRFVMPSKSKHLKKLLYFYYEICPKLDSNGKLKQEMILVWWVYAKIKSASAKHFLVTAFEMIYSTPTSTFEAIHSVSCASCASPSLSNHSYPLHDNVLNTATHTFERTQSSPSHQFTNTPRV
jgi:coatomer subunit beta